MAARARGRPSQIKDDADEERNLWKQIREDARSIDVLIQRSNEKLARMQELEKIINEFEGRGERYPVEAGAELMDLLRENIKLTDEMQASMDGESEGGNGIIQNMEIISALRVESEVGKTAANNSRASSTVKIGRSTKRGKLEVPPDTDRESAIADSPGGPSPKVTAPGGAASRLLKQGGASRSGSVPAARETSVKVEDADGDTFKAAGTPTPSTSTVASAGGSAPSASAGAPAGERLKLTAGAEVFYRNTPRPTPRGKPSAAAAHLEQPEGEGILCSVTSVIGEGKQRRYEIRDIDDSGPTPPTPYRASVSALVPIPPVEMNEKLPPLSGGRQVLALYPGTTTFYKAEVSGGKDSGKRGLVRLRFEGEDEASLEQEVERRYVLLDPVK